MIKVLPLKGPKALRALNIFGALLLGIQVTPLYWGVKFEEFFDSLNDKPEHEKESIIRKALLLVQLQPDEIETLLSFVTDPNGVPYSAASIKNLSPDEIHEMAVAVCMEIGRIKVHLLSKAEKKS